jgi:hypothetical protein
MKRNMIAAAGIAAVALFCFAGVKPASASPLAVRAVAVHQIADHWRVSISFGGGGPVYCPPPVYCAPAPVYYGPPPYYYAPPPRVFYGPRYFHRDRDDFRFRDRDDFRGGRRW